MYICLCILSKLMVFSERRKRPAPKVRAFLCPDVASIKLITIFVQLTTYEDVRIPPNSVYFSEIESPFAHADRAFLFYAYNYERFFTSC
jgi:hypothetical protein